MVDKTKNIQWAVVDTGVGDTEEPRKPQEICMQVLVVLIFNTVALLPLYCGFARIQTSFTHKKLCGTESENTSSSDVVYFAI